MQRLIVPLSTEQWDYLQYNKPVSSYQKKSTSTMRQQKIFFIFILLIAVTICFVKCIQQSSGSDPRGPLYAGADACLQCHKNIADSYMHTSHNKTSAPVFFDSIRTALINTKTMVNYPNGHTVKLEEERRNILQSQFEGDKKILSEKMEMVFGSGEKARTFGYWKDEQLFQLPLTYLTNLHQWTNSPGFPIDHPYYTRPIISRCFECHSSYVYHYNENTRPLEITEKFKPNTIVYGIDCERCHGPAKKHIDFHRENPAEKKATYIADIKSLSRTQQSDLCGTCHSGNPVSFKSIFAFMPGDSLKNYYMYYPGSFINPDVHGMQMQLLQQSACYKQSTLTCLTCHNPHKAENKTQQTITASCISCHNTSLHNTQMIQEKKNCITCHMPLRTSRSLDFNNSTENKNIPYKLRTHRIAIYPENEWE
ncbi:cytochrome c3 family protein [Terrimonas sp.]|uniref:cytochrome c3 family protein n=1 Tax=Terrimonas sp. TaxID=1914338 RepID=UPI001F0C2283|nr:multiheme c-type cytochrome [Terrimonas sp.]